MGLRGQTHRRQSWEHNTQPLPCYNLRPITLSFIGKTGEAGCRTCDFCICSLAAIQPKICNSKTRLNMSEALILYCLYNLAQSSIRRKGNAMLRIQLLFSTITLFVRIEQLCRSIRTLSPNRSNVVALFEGSTTLHSIICTAEALIVAKHIC